MVSNVKRKTSSRHMQPPSQQNRGSTVVRQQLFSACRGGKKTDQEEHTGGLGWGSIRGRRAWHGTYAWRREALIEGMRPQSGWEGEARARSRRGPRRKAGEGGRALERQRVARKMAVASGGRRRHGRRRCAARGWLRARGGRQRGRLHFRGIPR